MRVAIVGDSHTQILGPLLRRALEAQGATVVRVTARPGWSVARYLREGLLPSAAAGADTAWVLLGGNDDPAAAPAAYPGRLRAAVATLRRAGVRRIVWVGPFPAQRPDVDARHRATEAAMRRLLPALGVEFISGYEAAAQGWVKPEHYRDGVHLTRRGYERLLAGILYVHSQRGWRRFATLGAMGLALLASVGFLYLTSGWVTDEPVLARH